jgi:hypothetical protein
VPDSVQATTVDMRRDKKTAPVRPILSLFVPPPRAAFAVGSLDDGEVGIQRRVLQAARC